MMADCEWIKIEGPSKYQDVLAQMESIVEKVISGELKDAIIITEHEDVITKGTGSSEENEIISKSEIEVITTGRGGKLTYHGHGQRVVYPIIDLSNNPWNRDLKKYLNFLHQWIILTYQ
jgi:lipoyl(octanoyl) transferase